MKTKIIVILLSVVAVISFTALTTTKESAKSSSISKSYPTGGGETVSDRDQFN